MTNLCFTVFELFRRHCLQFSLPQLTKLRISQNIRYIQMPNIESNVTTFGQCYNLLNNYMKYIKEFIYLEGPTFLCVKTIGPSYSNMEP